VKTFIGASSLKGRRDEQQDSYCFARLEGSLVVAVCDGNGGEGGGDLSGVAARKALSEACIALSKLEGEKPDCEKQLKALGLKALKKAAGKVNYIKQSNEWDSAGTTLTLIIVTPELMGTFWVGDSPAYHFENSGLKPLIVPHTLAEELIREGQFRESISQQETLSCVLVQCLGHKTDEPGVNIKKHDGNCFCIVGSDGFFDYMPLDYVRDFIDEGFVTLCIQQMTEELVRKALDNGSDDNVTAVMFSYHKSEAEKKATQYF